MPLVGSLVTTVVSVDPITINQFLMSRAFLFYVDLDISAIIANLSSSKIQMKKVGAETHS